MQQALPFDPGDLLVMPEPQEDTLRTLDLFAGAGGLTLGFEMSDLGYLPVFAVEADPSAARKAGRHQRCPMTPTIPAVARGYQAKLQMEIAAEEPLIANGQL